MERKYRTSHQGIAAYLITKGYEIERTEHGTTKAGKDCINLEFNIDPTAGRELGDAFFDGNVSGNLKSFYDACYTVRQRVYETKNNR